MSDEEQIETRGLIEEVVNDGPVTSVQEEIIEEEVEPVVKAKHSNNNTENQITKEPAQHITY